MNDSNSVEQVMISATATRITSVEEEFESAVKPDMRLICFRSYDCGLAEVAYASKRSVAVCSLSGHINRRFSVDYDIEKIMWAQFSRTKDDRKDTPIMHCLAIIGEQEITFYNVEDSHPFSYFVPFRIRNVYQMKDGLLIEQFCTREDEFELEQEDNVNLFSLTHPLNELLPVLYRPRELIGPWLFCWEHEDLDIIDSFDDLILAFDQVAKTHRLYHIRHTLEEELRSSLFLMRNQQIERRQNLTPQGPKYSTPKTQINSRGGCQAMSVQTRSMLRAGKTRAFPLESPALSHIGTPKASELSYDSFNSFRLTSATQPTLVSVRSVNITKILERDLNNDIFYADFCLECVWTEAPRKDNRYPASKMFLSQSFCRHTYVNFFVPEAKQLRCFRLSDVDHKSIVQNSFGTILCLDATYIPKNKHTVVLESEHLLTLYSGHSKVCTVSYPSIVEEGIRSIQPIILDTLALLSGNNLFSLSVRPFYGDKMVEELFTTCITALASHEKSSTLLSHWRVYNTNDYVVTQQKNYVCPLLHAAFKFLLQEIGITIVKHPYIWISKDERSQEQPHTKVRRPPQTKEEMLQRLHSFGAQTFPFRRDNTVEIEIDAEKSLFSSFQTIFAAIHSTWQQWGLREDWNTYQAQVVHYLRICAFVSKSSRLFDLYQAEFPIQEPLIYKIHCQDEADLSFDRNMYLENAFSLFTLIGDMLLCSLDKSRFNTQIYTCSPLVAQFVLAVSVGIGIVGSQIDLQRLLGKRWKKMASITNGEVLKTIIRKQVSKEEKCAKLLKFFNMDSKFVDRLPCVFQLLIAKIIHYDREAAEHLYPQNKDKMLEFPTATFFNDIAIAVWPTDKRSTNVSEMLRSDKPVLINTSALANVPNQLAADEREAQEVYLHGTCIRYLAQSFGRAMKSFRYLAQLPCHPETGSVALDLCLSARLFPSNLSYEIPISDATKPYREWGEFYNGVASALRVGSGDEIKLDGEYLLSTCVKQEKITNPTAAGLLYGFALNGHLLSSTYYVSEMLITLDEFQSVALLLGYGIAKMGSADPKTYKMLGTQLPFIMGPTNLPINIPSINQTAAIASLGFLFARTGNTVMVKKLLNEIGKSLPPEESPATDRYAYRLNAGFAVGLICLGQGNDILARRPAFEEEQPGIVERLIHMMKGHPRKTCVFSSNPAPILEINNSAGVQQPLSRHIKERECINTHLSSQAACVALGLMFFQTGNNNIASQMLLPQEARPLEEIKPDLILARILCYHLIMWDDIQPNIDFIQNLVPKVVENRMRTRWMVEAEERDEEISPFNESDIDRDPVFDLETLAQVYCNVVAGSALAIGLRFKNAPPQARREAYNTILLYIRLFLHTNMRRYVRRFVELAGPNVHSLVVNCLLTSLGLLVSTTGDVETIRIARSWRVHEHVMAWMRSTRKHQEQMVAHQVLGMLFLGEGTYAWKEDTLSNALLLIAFYPQVCHGINDSRFYHQPLRFLWTQAVEPRLIAVRSSAGLNDKYTAKVDVTATYLDDTVAKFETPTIMPPIELLRSLEIGGDNMETLKYDLTLQKDREALKRGVIYNHGRFYLHDYRFDENALTEVAFTINLPEFTSSFNPPTSPTSAHRNVKFTWPSLESITGIKKQMTELQNKLKLSTNKKYIAPELIFAEKLATWAKETPLAFALEYAIDMLQNNEEATPPANVQYNQAANMEADKENEPNR